MVDVISYKSPDIRIVRIGEHIEGIGEVVVNAELKPCPFCGNSAVYPEEGYRGPIKEVYVYCPNCMTKGPVIYRHHRSYEHCGEQAVYAWNRRDGA